MWTSALHSVTNFVLGDVQDEQQDRPTRRSQQQQHAPPQVPQITEQQWHAMTPDQQQQYMAALQQYQQWQQQQQQQQPAGGALMSSAPVSPSPAGGGAGAAGWAHDDAAELQAKQQADESEEEHTRIAPAVFEATGEEITIEQQQHLQQQQAAPAPYSSQPAEFLGADQPAGDEGEGPDDDAPAHPDDESAADAGSGGGTRALFARFLPAFGRSGPSDGSEEGVGGAHPHAHRESSTAAAVATARGVFSAAAGTVGHAFSGIKSSLPKFTVSAPHDGGGEGGGHPAEVQELIQALHAEESRSAQVSREYKAIIAEMGDKLREQERQVEELAREAKQRDRDAFDWKLKCNEANKKVKQMEEQLAQKQPEQQGGGGGGGATNDPALQAQVDELQQALKAKDEQLATLAEKLAAAEKQLKEAQAKAAATVAAATTAAAPPAGNASTATATPASTSTPAVSSRIGATSTSVSAAGTVVARTPLTWSCPDCHKLNLRTKPVCGKQGCNGARPELPVAGAATIAPLSTAVRATPAAAPASTPAPATAPAPSTVSSPAVAAPVAAEPAAAAAPDSTTASTSQTTEESAPAAVAAADEPSV